MSHLFSFSREKDAQMVAKQYEQFFSDSGRGQIKKNTRIFFVVMVLVTTLFAIANWGVITNWGKVNVSRINISSHGQENLSILLYVPDTATAENPAPCLLCFHGNSGSGRNHESWAMEFARRGFVVLSPDLYGAGDSDNENSDMLMSYPSVFEKPFQVYELAQGLDYVDSDNIITSGHSLGGTTAVGVGAHYNAKAILTASDGSTLDFANKMAGIEVFDNLYDEIWHYSGNVLTTYGDAGKFDGKDEAFMVELANKWIDKRVEVGVSEYKDWTYTTVGEVIGSFEEGNALQFGLDHRVHEGAFVSQECIGKLLDFAMKAVSNVPNYIEPTSQIWMAKDYLGLFGCISFSLLIIAMALFFIEEIPYFSDIRRAPVRNVGMRGIGMVISCTLSLVFPFIALKTKSLGIENLLISPTGADTKQGFGPFHLTYSNYAMAVVIVTSLLGIAGLLLFLLTDGKKKQITPNELGLTESDSNKFNIRLLTKPLLLTLIVVGVAFAMLQLLEDLTGTTFYAWFFGFKPLAMTKLKYYFPYIIVWILCFTVSCLSLNVERRLPTTGNEVIDTVLQVLFNVFFATIIITIAVWCEWNIPMYGIKNLELFNHFQSPVERLYGMPLGMLVGVTGSTILFKQTRNTWLCAILMGTVAALCCVLYGQVRIY